MNSEAQSIDGVKIQRWVRCGAKPEGLWQRFARQPVRRPDLEPDAVVLGLTKSLL
jgi:hypothetical protein